MKGRIPSMLERTTGRVWAPMLKFASCAGFLAALFFLCEASALGQFSNYLAYPWQGGANNFYGSTLVASGGTFSNCAALIYNTSVLPADTGPLFGWSLAPGVTRSGNYFYGVGVLDEVNRATMAINNGSGGTMQGVVTGSGQGFAAGVYEEVNGVTINNSGLMDGEIWNNDGTAAGVYATGIVNFTNNAGAILSGTAPYFAGGIYTAGGGAQALVNNGTILATATGATQGASSNQAYCGGIVSFTYDPSAQSPIYVVNNGLLMASSPGGATNICQAANLWDDQNNVTFINNGVMSVNAAGNNGEADGIYFGANNADVTFCNTGTIIVGGNTPGGEGVWLENDGTTGDMHFNNSGTIISGKPFAVSIAAYSGGPFGHAWVTNTGTIVGGWFGLGWPGAISFFDSGDIHTGLAWLGGAGNVDVHISGLPTIQPTLGAGSGSNTLIFNLNGTLQTVNGNAASGTDLPSSTWVRRAAGALWFLEKPTSGATSRMSLARLPPQPHPWPGQPD